ncbi:MAG: acetyl-CoA carboxylase biotin carboxyl carrier protein subunit [Bacteroidales bacterium]|nr:acetyl-CoA carboxylase biotin carboxyl carrier protein subunit [Bacteroidales bacterium]
MALEIQINDRKAYVDNLNQEDSKMLIDIDGKHYEIDIVMVEDNVYSILYQGKSYNVELIPKENPKSYIVNTLYNSYDVDIIDAERKYLMSRKSDDDDDSDSISTPMPGKVVSIPVKTGDKVSAGTTVIVVSAMKMESEYKVKKDRVIKNILVKEGDIILANQILLEIE